MSGSCGQSNLFRSDVWNPGKCASPIAREIIRDFELRWGNWIRSVEIEFWAKVFSFRFTSSSREVNIGFLKATQIIIFVVRLEQCDQIGRFSSFLGHKFRRKSSEMFCDFRAISIKHPFLVKTAVSTFWVTFGKILGYFWFKHQVTLVLKQWWSPVCGQCYQTTLRRKSWFPPNYESLK